MTIDDRTPSEKTLIDLPNFLQLLKGERQTAVVVLGPPLAGKTRFARLLAQQPGFAYLDVLDELSKQRTTMERIDQFDPEDLQKLILEATDQPGNQACQVLLVDEIDFLFPIWAGELRPFKEIVRKLAHPRRAVAFALFLLDRPEWTTWELLTAGRKNRIISLDSIKPL